MRIAWVLWRGALGGAEALAVDLVDVARRHGHDVTLAVVTDAGVLAERLRDRAVPTLEWGAATERTLVRRARSFARVLAEVAPDGIVVPTTGLLPLVLRLGGYRSRIVAVEHGDLLQFPSLPMAVRLRKRAMRKLGRSAVSVEVGVSRYMLSRLRDGDEARRTVCIPNGVDVSRFTPRRHVDSPAEPITLGWAGRMIPGKGIDVLLRALPMVEAPVHCRLAGDGPEKAALQRLCAELQLGQVSFVGRVRHPERFWAACDVGVAPSDTFIESFGIAPVEAGAAGLPVIASANGAYPEVVADGATGTVVAPGDAEGLARAIAAYVRDPALRAEHGAAARTRVEMLYSLEQCLAGYLAVLADAPDAVHDPAPDHTFGTRCRLAQEDSR